MSPHRHLSYQDRVQIQTDLTSKPLFREIANRLDKDPTTIAKEVKRSRIAKNVGYHNFAHNDCLHRKTCILTYVCSSCER